MEVKKNATKNATKNVTKNVTDKMEPLRPLTLMSGMEKASGCDPVLIVAGYPGDICNAFSI